MDWNVLFTSALKTAVSLDTVVFALAAIGVNIHFGYTGLLNFGQSAFLGVAAYGLAVTVASFNLPFWLGIGIGLGAVVLLAMLLGVPTLRLRADYLAITTIAAAEIVRLVFRSVYFKDIFGGSDGRQGFSGDFYALNPYSTGTAIGPVEFSANELWVLTVGWIFVALACSLVFLVMKSPWGRVLKAIREDEDAVRSLGKNVFSYKMQSLLLGGLVGCLGGFIFALGQASVQPDLYGTELTFFAFTIVILGGAARVFGPVIGAIIFWVLLVFIGNFFAEAVGAGIIPQSIMTTTQAGTLRYILTGLGLMLLLIFRPQGIFGDKRELSLDAR